MSSDFEIVANKKAKAPIWKNFGLKKENGNLVPNIAVCKLCNMCVKYSGGTSNLGSHMQSHHPSVLVKPKSIDSHNDCVMLSNANEKVTPGPIKLEPAVTTVSKVSGHGNQSSIPLLFASQTKYAANSMRAKTITSSIRDFLIQDMRPFRTVETPWFKKMVTTLDPRYSVPARKQFSSVLIPEKYAEVREVVKLELNQAEQIAVTTDGWTSRATQSYITVTSTHINKQWELKNYVLMTRAMPESHTGQNIADFLKDALEEWGIQLKPLYLVSDNAANMKRAAEILECELHLGCFAHTLNLAAQKGLKVKGVSSVLARVRRIVGFFHRSTTAAALLQLKADTLGLPNHKLVIDVPNRWNSAYDMLERYLEMQDAVVATLLSKELTNKDKDIKFLQDEDITLATKVMECLKPLKQAYI